MLIWSAWNVETDLVVLSFDISFRLYHLHLSAGGRPVDFTLYITFNRLNEGDLDRNITVAALARRELLRWSRRLFAHGPNRPWVACMRRQGRLGGRARPVCGRVGRVKRHGSVNRGSGVIKPHYGHV